MRRGRRRVRKRTWWQLMVVLFGLLVFAAAVGGAAGLAVVKSQINKIPRVSVGLSLSFEQQSDSEARNFLLVGIDSALGVDPDSPIHNDRDINTLLTDSVILVRIDPEADRVAMLSIPRDLWVPISGKGWSERVNAARGIGGASTLIETVSDFLGVPIHHYVEINFAGFLRIVEAVDGVPVEIAQSIRDDSVGLRIEQAGVVTLDPDAALAYVRTRRPLTLIEGGNPANDDDWVPLGVWNDLERNQRQQEFMVATLKRAVEKGIRNPLTLRRVANELLDGDSPSITLDDRITLGQIVDLGDEFRSFRVDQIERYKLPVADATIDGKQVLLLVEDAAQPALEFFRAGSLAGVRVRVLNGNPSGTVAGVEDALERAGFSVVERANADRFDVGITMVRYTVAFEDEAQELARHVEPVPRLELVAEIDGADVELVVGADYAGVSGTPRDSAS
ncbi:LCP family protein [Candidatus Poriferisocius sp.]|uniref:LCP family protein n=1 Tax=Candidatus Poriferisocius sp. TaxID=3101276 RepID=UPI003B52749D